MDEIDIYLDTLFEGMEGLVYSPVKTDNDWYQGWFEWPQQRENLKQHIQSGLGDIYISPAIYKERRATKDAIKKVQVCWVDFDGLEKIDFKDVVLPNLVVQTSIDTKNHCYWKVGPNQPAAIEDTNRRLTYYLGTDIGGWDVTQLLRPPGTVNYKYSPALPVTITTTVDGTHTLKEFEAVPKVTTPPSAIVPVEKLLDIQSILNNKPVVGKLLKMIKLETPKEPYRSSFLTRVAHELAEEDYSHLEIVSLLKYVDDRVGKFKGRHDQLSRLSQIADYAIHKTMADEAIIIYTPEEILKHVENLNWILPQWLHTTGQMIVSSAPGVGKTSLLLQLAYCLEKGERFLGLLAPVKHKIFWMSLEMDKSEIKYFLEHQKNEWNTYPEFKIIDEGSNLSRYEELVDEHQPTVVIIDSLTELFDEATENPNTQARHIMRWCRKIRRRYGIALILIHHNRKASEGNKKPKNLSDLEGSFHFGRTTDTVLQLWEDHRGIEVSSVKARYGPKSSFYVKRNENLWYLKEGTNVSNEQRTTGSDQERNQEHESSGDRLRDESDGLFQRSLPFRFSGKDSS